jgi:hypothetical protein
MMNGVDGTIKELAAAFTAAFTLDAGRRSSLEEHGPDLPLI